MQFPICKIKHLVLDEMLSIPVTFVYESLKRKQNLKAFQRHEMLLN